MKYYIFCALLLILTACNQDADALLLAGKQVDYNFTNSVLEDQFINENLVNNFTILSGEGDNQETLEALYLGDINTISTDTVILYLHGNSKSMNDYWGYIARLANLGHQHRFGVMMFDYRGFGNSTGQSTNINSMMTDAEACMQWLSDQGLTSDRLILYGASLGCMPSAHIAAYSEILKSPKLVLEAPQTAIDVLIQDITGLSVSSSTVTDFGYDVPTALSNFSGHLLWLHSKDDNVASYENFQKVYEDYSNPLKSSYIVEDAGHGTAWNIGFEKIEILMLDLIKK